MPLFQERHVEHITYGCKLTVGIGDDVMIKHPQLEGKYRTTLVGMHAFEFLILKIPSTPGLKKKFSRGSTVVSRYLHRGVVYGFNSSVLSVASEPCPLLFIAYPQSCETLSLRNDERIYCLVPCKVYTENDGYEGYIVDLGVGGCRINFVETGTEDLIGLTPGSDVYVDFMLCGHEELFVVKGFLRHFLAGTGKYSLGIEFSGMVAEQRKYLESYVQEISKAC